MSELVGFSMILFIIGMGVFASLNESTGCRVVCSVFLLASWMILFGLVLQMPARG